MRLQLLSFVDRASVIRLLLLILLASILLLADGYALIVISGPIGRYLALAVVASTGLIGLFFLVNSILATLAVARSWISGGYFPRRDFARLASLLVAAVLILIPGLLTDALGLLMYSPPFRLLFGLLLTRPLEAQLWQLYEHVKLEEAERTGQ